MRVSNLVLSRVERGERLLIVEKGVVVDGVWRECGERLFEGGVLLESGFSVRVLDVFREGKKYWCGYIEVELEEGDECLMSFDILGPDIWQICERRT